MRRPSKKKRKSRKSKGVRKKGRRLDGARTSRGPEVPFEDERAVEACFAAQ
jgi:hypothetical protein